MHIEINDAHSGAIMHPPHMNWGTSFPGGKIVTPEPGEKIAAVQGGVGGSLASEVHCGAGAASHLHRERSESPQ